MKSKKVSDVQLLAELLTCGNVQTAAEHLGISRQTIYSRLRNEGFFEKYQQAQNSFIAAATGELTSALDESILNLRQIMKDTKAPHSVRVQAADIILRHCLRYTETNNILRRLERLEKKAERSDNI